MQSNKKALSIVVICGLTLSSLLLWPLAFRTSTFQNTPSSENPTLQKASSEFPLGFNLARSFTQTVSIPISKLKEHKVEKIYFGNSDIGYFRVNRYTKAQDNIEIRFQPPSFLKPIQFCARSKNGGFVKLFEQKFDQPQQNFFKNVRVEREGKFKVPFFLISAQWLPSPEKFGTYYPAIVNKLGEVVWAHLLEGGQSNISKYLVSKKIDNTLYATLAGEQASYFEVNDLAGQRIKSVFPKKASPQYVVHHDFVFDSKNIIATFGHSIRYVKNFFPLVLQNLSPLQALTESVSFLSTPVTLVDLEKNREVVAWDPFDAFFRPQDMSWQNNPPNSVLKLTQPPGMFLRWGEKAQIDWSHGNSIEHIAGKGFLVSFRNLSRVVMLDEQFKKVLWTLGNSPADTYKTIDDTHAFAHQHHAQLVDDTHLLLMDNHTSPPAANRLPSRVVVYSLEGSQAKVVWNFSPPHGNVIFNRGSVYVSPMKTIVAFYPDSLGGMDHLFEIDRKTATSTAQMRIFFNEVKRNFSDKQRQEMLSRKLVPIDTLRDGGGNRAVPLTSIGDETLAEVDVDC